MLLFEISNEVTFVVDTHLRHHFFETQKRILHQLSRTFETQAFKVLRGRQTGFIFEQVTQSRRGEIN